MTEAEIPDYNVFMMCTELRPEAFSSLPQGFHIRNCRTDEIETWKAFPFDTPAEAHQHAGFMDHFFETTYAKDLTTFLENTLLVCDANDLPVATCSIWRTYGKFTAVHWLKTIKSIEGKGLGRALLTELLTRLQPEDFPLYLHTQPGSFRAIGLYSDFGFQLLTEPTYGTRPNQLNESLPILREFMAPKHFEALRFTVAPASFHIALEGETMPQF